MRLIAQPRKSFEKKVFLHQNFSRIMSVKSGFVNMDSPSTICDTLIFE